MRWLFTSVFLAVSFLSFSARGEITVDAVRAALDLNNFSRLESLFSEAHQDALTKKSFADIRETYSALFETAHKGRLDRANAWLAAYPNSPYAATALAWMHHERAYLSRGEANVYATSKEAMQAFHDELVLTKEFSDLAMGQSDDFLPAIDTAVRLKQTHIDDGSILPLVERMLDIAPDRQGLRLGLESASLRWGGSVKESLALCAFLAEKVPSYDAELCLIEFVFKNELKGEMRALAIEALDGRDEPFLDYARLNVYLREWKGRDEAAAEAERIHWAKLLPRVNAHTFELDLRRMEYAFENPLYLIEAQDAFISTLRERLEDSPQDHRILDVLVRNILDKNRSILNRDEGGTHLNDAWLLWRDMLDLGALLPETWQRGADIDYHRHKGTEITKRRAMFHANQIYYSNHDPIWLSFYIESLFQHYMLSPDGGFDLSGDGVDIEALDDAELCPMFRVSRLYEYICDADPTANGCNPQGWGAEFPGQIRRFMRSSDACPSVQQAEIEDLVFAPIPIERFFEETAK